MARLSSRSLRGASFKRRTRYISERLLHRRFETYHRVGRTVPCCISACVESDRRSNKRSYGLHNRPHQNEARESASVAAPFRAALVCYGITFVFSPERQSDFADYMGNDFI